MWLIWFGVERCWKIEWCERNIKSKEDIEDFGSRYRFRANIEGIDYKIYSSMNNLKKNLKFWWKILLKLIGIVLFSKELTKILHGYIK